MLKNSLREFLHGSKSAGQVFASAKILAHRLCSSVLSDDFP
jgi:hypothetical protein